MFADRDTQLRILDLAALDTEVAQANHQRATLPELADIDALKRTRNQVGQALVAANTAVSDAEYALSKADQDIEPVKARIEREQKRLDSGSVSDAKIVQGLLTEVEKLKQRLSDLEDISLDAMEVLENASAQQASALAAATERDSKLRALVAVRDEKFQAIDATIAQLQVRRGEMVEAISSEIMTVYERTKERTGLGAAALVNRRCTGCGLELNPAQLRAIEALPADHVDRCEECSRILIVRS